MTPERFIHALTHAGEPGRHTVLYHQGQTINEPLIEALLTVLPRLHNTPHVTLILPPRPCP